MEITIFTPTYNRGYILKCLFYSLMNQTNKSFEWIVYNDGSIDDTEELVKKWKKQADFPIIYIFSENGGKHRAINKGLDIAKGRLFFIVDSDDYLPDDSIDIILKTEQGISKAEKHKFIGICGQRGYSLDESNGTTFNGTILDITSLESLKNNISGDKAEVFYTDLFRNYRFPEFKGENFVTERVVWDRMAHDGYLLRYFNKIIYLGNYLNDGLTKNYYEVYRKNPRGYGLYVSQQISFGCISKKDKWSELLTYYRNTKNTINAIQMAHYLKMNSICFICGLLMKLTKVYIIKFLVKIKHLLHL